MPRELTTHPTEPAGIGGGSGHFHQVVPVVANLKPEVRVEEDKGATGPHGHPAACKPQGQSHLATVQLQEGGRGWERLRGQDNNGAETREQAGGREPGDAGCVSETGVWVSAGEL